LYVFSFAFWILVLGIAALHAMVGARAQRWVLLVTSVAVYGSFNLRLLLVLGFVIVATWAGIRVAHYTDDPLMLRFVRLVAAFTAFLPLIVVRLSDGAVGLVGDLAAMLSVGNGEWSIETLIPVGVAFYTLQAIDAMLTVHKRHQKPNFLDHVLFVSFFPTIFIGPVQQYDRLMPQLRRRRSLTGHDLDVAALWILFGVFWKLAVADNLLPIADLVFSTTDTATGPEVVVGAVAFAVGIIADLAGYTAMVVGLARLFGVRIAADNVRRPHLARSPIDFWDRWLTPVTDWMLRYTFLQVGGSDRGSARTVGALALTFLAGALWYGTRPTILVWAGLHFIAVVLQLAMLRRKDPSSSAAVGALKLAATFGFVSYTWIWFRAASLGDAVRLHRRLLTPEFTTFSQGALFTTLLFLGLLLASEYLFAQLHTETPRPLWSAPLVRGTVFSGLIATTLVLATTDLHDSVLGAS